MIALLREKLSTPIPEPLDARFPTDPSERVAEVPSPREAVKLQVLRQQDQERSWESLDDERVCVLCGRDFRGRDVHITIKAGRVRCHCPSPNCRGTLRHFVFPGNPLVDPDAWSDWMKALENDETDDLPDQE